MAELVWKNGESRSSLGDLYQVSRLSEFVWQTSKNGTAFSGWSTGNLAAQAVAQEDYDRLTTPVPPAKIICEQDWTPSYFNVEDGGAARIYCVEHEADKDHGVEVRLQSYDETKAHETFKQFEGKRIRVTVEVVE